MRERFNALREPSQVFRLVGECLVGVEEHLEFHPMLSRILRFPGSKGDVRQSSAMKDLGATHVRPRSLMARSTLPGVRGLIL